MQHHTHTIVAHAHKQGDNLQRHSSALEINMISQSYAAVLCLLQAMASQAEQDRLLAPHLAAGTPVYLEVGEKYTLMPRSWLQAWRSYVNTTKKGRALAPAPPEPIPSLQEACQGLLCSCHIGPEAMLAFPLPPLIHRCSFFAKPSCAWYACI